MTLKRIITILALCLLPLFSITAKAQEVPEYIIHKVRWYEGINDIAKKYNVPIEVIVEVNNLPKAKVKKGQELKIPADLYKYYLYQATHRNNSAQGNNQSSLENQSVQNNQSVEENRQEGDNPNRDLNINQNQEINNNQAVGQNEDVNRIESLNQDQNPPAQEDQPWSWSSVFGFKNKVDALIMLPLGADDGSNDNYLDFYSGALMAVKDLGDKGIASDIQTLDLSKEQINEETLEKIQKADMVIGPVSYSQIENILSAEERTPIISPLDPRAIALADSSANFIQAPSSSVNQYTDLAAWLLEDYSLADNVVLISENAVILSAGMKAFKATLDSAYVKYKTFSYDILQGRDILTDISAVMVPEITNRVVVLSENEAFVNDVVRNLNLIIYNKINVVLYSASKIRSFNTIDVENLHSVNLHVCCSYFIDYNDPRVKRFLMSYRALFGTEPSQFAFQGYDVASYFIKTCHDLGHRWPSQLSSASTTKMLQSDFKIEKSGNGFVNTGIRRIIYGSDYSVKEFSR